MSDVAEKFLNAVRNVVAATLKDERERQIGYLSKLCWSVADIRAALRWGVDESQYEAIDKQLFNSRWLVGKNDDI